jgi:hypothetical protein
MSEEHSCLAAIRVLAAHATSAAAERSWSAWGRQFPAYRASRIVPTGMRAMCVQVNSRSVSSGPEASAQARFSVGMNKLRRDRARKLMNDQLCKVGPF